jgi:protein MpaA
MTGNVLEGWRSETYGQSRRGVPLRVFLPEAADGRVSGLLTAAQHGEEADTTLVVRRLLERMPGAETSWAVVPVVNPDGLLDGVRQNAAGVDLNRNFPASTWRPQPSFTYPPGIDPALRREPNRTNRSSPGEAPGSEPETTALMALVERLQPGLVVDLHSPLELILVRDGAEADADRLARAASLRTVRAIESDCPGAFDDWLVEQGIPALVYEIEHAGLPALCVRHLPGLTALVRSEPAG